MAKFSPQIISVKFGGTSMGTADSIMQCARIVAGMKDEGASIVTTVSAVVGITDRLIEAIDLALHNKTRKLDSLILTIKDRHTQIYDSLSLHLNDESCAAIIRTNIDIILERLETVLKGVLLVGDISDQSRALVMAMGEKLSSHLFLLALHTVGVSCERIQAEKIIKTDGNYLEANVAMPATIAACRKALLPLLKKNITPVVTGFIGKDPHGGTTLLGRGGSDYTAAILGVSLKARHIELRKDVTGVLSSNPRMVHDTRQWDEVDMNLMSELCYSGAEIVNPKTISLAQKYLIPLEVKSTFDLSAPGTRVGFDETRNVRSLVIDKDYTLIHIENPDILNQVGFISRVTEIVQQHDIPIDVCATSETSFSFSLRGKHVNPRLVKELKNFGDTRLIPNLTKICLVGHDIASDYILLSDAFALAQEHAVAIRAVSIGASGKNVTLLLDNKNIEKWAQPLHTRLFATHPAKTKKAA